MRTVFSSTTVQRTVVFSAAVLLLVMGTGLAIAAGPSAGSRYSSAAVIASDRPVEPAPALLPSAGQAAADKAAAAHDKAAAAAARSAGRVAGRATGAKRAESAKTGAKKKSSASKTTKDDDERETVVPPVREEGDEHSGADDDHETVVPPVREEEDHHGSD